MRILKIAFLVSLAIAALQLCSSKKDKETQTENKWPELDAFHMTMAEAYHPFKDSADLKAAKNLADNLANESETWAASSRPQTAGTEKITAELMKLKNDCRTFSDHVKSGSPDVQLGKELTSLHAQFHAILEAVGGDGEMKEHE